MLSRRSCRRRVCHHRHGSGELSASPTRSAVRTAFTRDEHPASTALLRTGSPRKRPSDGEGMTVLSRCRLASPACVWCRKDRSGMSRTVALAHLVVLGSSAGGIEVLSTLLATLPPDFPAPLVIAQHLDPTRPSHLGEILARQTVLPIHSVTAR